jgi:hypothetical protein
MYGLALRKDSRQGGAMNHLLNTFIKPRAWLRWLGTFVLTFMLVPVFHFAIKSVWKLIEDRLVTAANQTIDEAMKDTDMWESVFSSIKWYFSGVSLLELLAFPLIAVLFVEIFRLRNLVKSRCTIEISETYDSEIDVCDVEYARIAIEDINTQYNTLKSKFEKIRKKEFQIDQIEYLYQDYFDQVVTVVPFAGKEFYEDLQNFDGMDEGSRIGVLEHGDEKIFLNTKQKALYNKVLYKSSFVNRYIESEIGRHKQTIRRAAEIGRERYLSKKS